MECAGEGGRRPFYRRIVLTMLKSMPPPGSRKTATGVTIFVIISSGDDPQHRSSNSQNKPLGPLDQAASLTMAQYGTVLSVVPRLSLGTGPLIRAACWRHRSAPPS